MRDHPEARAPNSSPAITAADVTAHFAWAAGKGGWTARLDWILIETVFAGRGLDVAATKTGRARPECRARFACLCPHPGDLRLRELVIAEARSRMLQEVS